MVVGRSVFHDALSFIKENPAVQSKLGSDLVMMNCNGKIYPLLKNCNFEIMMFGNAGKGRVSIQAEKNFKKNKKDYSKKEWTIKNMVL
jgi:hypothetical protein